MHLLDLTHWLLGAAAAALRAAAHPVLGHAGRGQCRRVLGERRARSAPWAMLHVTWTEWKNLFSLEVYCRTAKLQVDGLVRSYGAQQLRVYRMLPELGPPELDEYTFAAEDVSWEAEWENFVGALSGEQTLLGGLDDARYAWQRVQDAYAMSPQYEALGRALGSGA